MILNHRQEADGLFLLSVSIDHRFRDQFLQSCFADGREIYFRFWLQFPHIHVDYRQGFALLLRHIVLLIREAVRFVSTGERLIVLGWLPALARRCRSCRRHFQFVTNREKRSSVLLPRFLVKIHRQQPASLVLQERANPNRVFADKVRTDNVIGKRPEFSRQAINLLALLVFGK